MGFPGRGTECLLAGEWRLRSRVMKRLPVPMPLSYLGAFHCEKSLRPGDKEASLNGFLLWQDLPTTDPEISLVSLAGRRLSGILNAKVCGNIMKGTR